MWKTSLPRPGLKMRCNAGEISLRVCLNLPGLPPLRRGEPAYGCQTGALEVWRFAGFTLDLGRGTLLADGGSELSLRPKSFALLQLLVENAGRLLSRDTIMSAVWPDVVVGDEAITQCIADIRRALGDEAQRMLRTVPRRGYLFAAEVSSALPVMATPRAARRLAGILAADVVGFSRLMGRDEQGGVEGPGVRKRTVSGPVFG